MSLHFCCYLYENGLWWNGNIAQSCPSKVNEMLKVIFLSKTIVKLHMYYFTFNDVFFFYVNLTFTSPLFFSTLFGVNHENSRVICLSRFSMPTKKSCSPFDVNQHNAEKSEIGIFFSYSICTLVKIILCFLFTIKNFPSVLALLPV